MFRTKGEVTASSRVSWNRHHLTWALQGRKIGEGRPCMESTQDRMTSDKKLVSTSIEVDN